MTAEANFWAEQGYYDEPETEQNRYSCDDTEENHLREAHGDAPIGGYYLCQ